MCLKLYLHGELLDEWDFQNFDILHEKALDDQNLQIDLQAENICKLYCFEYLQHQN